MKIYVLIASLVFLLLSCMKKDSESKNLLQWNMNRVEGISTGVLNQTITLTVFYPTTSNCDILDKFEQSIKNNIVSIKAYGHTEASTFCTQSAIEKNTPVSFKPTSSGSYELRFVNRDNSYFTHNLKIN